MDRFYTHNAVVFICILAISAATFAQPASTFTSSAESWWTVGDPGSAPGLSWSSTGGNPGGCLVETDESEGTVYWTSPNSSGWKGNLSSYYNCNLTFDLKQSTVIVPITDCYDIMIIRGDDQRIVYNTPYNPSSTWTSYIVPLNETGWKWSSISGSSVTAAEFSSFLSDVKRFRIRAEYSGLNYETNYLDNAAISCSAIILPVELSAFYGTQQAAGVAELTWVTETETNSKAFLIEKSLSGIVYDSIGYIPAQGTTTLSHTYTFTDDNFSEPCYYRLKQTDTDYKITYSDIIALSPEQIAEAAPLFSIYPNPASEHFTITSPYAISFIQIFDMKGQLIFSRSFQFSEHIHTYALDAPVAGGLYQVKVITSAGTFTKSLPVVH